MTVGLGPAKAQGLRDSARPMAGHRRRASVRDGQLQSPAASRSTARRSADVRRRGQHFSWAEIVAHAARDTRLRPGDVLGSGTLNAAACSSALAAGETRSGSSRATRSRSRPTSSAGSRPRDLRLRWARGRTSAGRTASRGRPGSASGSRPRVSRTRSSASSRWRGVGGAKVQDRARRRRRSCTPPRPPGSRSTAVADLAARHPPLAEQFDEGVACSSRSPTGRRRPSSRGSPRRASSRSTRRLTAGAESDTRPPMS